MRNALFGNVATAECAFPYSTGCRMRFSVECAFPHLRKRRPASRKSAFWPWALTENRILAVGPHAKAHSGPDGSRKSALWPRRLTQKRTLAPTAHRKPHSACVPSPKDVLCILATATKNRCNPGSAQRDPRAARPGKTWRDERPSSRGGATDPHPPSPPPTSTPSVPLPAPRKHQVLRLGLGCIKRTFRFGKWRVVFTPISLPCPTQQRGKTSNGSVEPRRKVKERRS